jgi:multisubunit Na+/H+ antiporter MnhE subunit
VAVAWLVWWVLLAALYLLLADSVVALELAAGAVCAAIAATGAVVVRRSRLVVGRPRLRWLAAAWRPLLGTFTDLGPLARVLVSRGILRRPGAGRVIERPFVLPGRDEREDAARLAFTEALGSLAPNTIVLDVDHARGVLLAHELHPTRDGGRHAAPLAP